VYDQIAWNLEKGVADKEKPGQESKLLAGELMPIKQIPVPTTALLHAKLWTFDPPECGSTLLNRI
jgi:hypothetical protein